jgi:hypothetical protein
MPRADLYRHHHRQFLSCPRGHQYIEEKRHAFEPLANQIERTVNPVENVVAMTR